MATNNASMDTVSDPQHPFGLPMGTVRAFMGLLILSYFWLVAFWPTNAKPFLGHMFLLPLVLYSFTLNRDPLDRVSFGRRILPILLRSIMILGTGAALFYLFSKGLDHARERLTPDVGEFQEWWLPFSGSLMIGLFAGIAFNWLFGPKGTFFQVIRAWLSVVAMVSLSMELGLFVIFLSSSGSDPGYVGFLRAYSLIEIGIVAAYYGTRV